MFQFVDVIYPLLGVREYNNILYRNNVGVSVI